MAASVPPLPAYRRDETTWAAFGALFAFGVVNAVLGPVLPFLRDAEGLSYLTGALHQAAYAAGGGMAGLLAARDRGAVGRGPVIVLGMVAAGLAGLLLGYGGAPGLTILAAFLMSAGATSALIRMWAVLADHHGPRRAVAMSEGEVAVSFAGILTPLAIGVLAGTALGWRFVFVLGALIGVVATVAMWRSGVPRPAGPPPAQDGAAGGWRHPTLLVVFAIVALEFTLAFWLATYLADDLGLRRGLAVAAVSLLFASSLVGRVLASRLAHHHDAERLLAAALVLTAAGLPALLLAQAAGVAAAGVVVTGVGMGALFPLTSAIHIRSSPLSADGALGQVLSVAAPGQLAGPLVAGAIAEVAGLRAGLLVLPVLVVLAAVALARHHRTRLPD